MLTHLRDRFADWRAKMVANPRFQRFAAAFPLTRPLARARAGALFDLAAGFVYSQTLAACVRLGLFVILREGPLPVADLAVRLALPLPGAERLLRAAAALDLIEERRGGRFALADLGAALLANPGVEAMIEHHVLLYADLADPVALLRGGPGGGRLQAFWSYAGSDPGGAGDAPSVAAYSQLMAVSQQLVADDIAAAYPFARHRRLLDVGGGEGAFLTHIAAVAPRLQMMLFDLPPVAARARHRFAAAGLSDRTDAVGGDFRTDSLPEGADLISFVRVLHDHDDAVVLDLLRKVRAALAQGGSVLVAEPMAGAARDAAARRMGDGYFGMYLFAMGSGRPRTPRMLAALLRDAGFTQIRTLQSRRPLLVSITVAKVSARAG